MMSISEFIRAAIGSFLGTLAFAGLLHVPKKAALPAAVVGMLAYLVYMISMAFGMSEPAATFVGALFGSLLGQYLARRMQVIATIFVLLSIVSAVPGLGLYRFMELLGSNQAALGAQTGINAMMSIAMIALGIGVGTFTYRLIFRSRRVKSGA